MKCLLTGATGFPCTSIVHKLVQAGYRVRPVQEMVDDAVARYAGRAILK
jgi:nucleoside-diphosphate-sugar epimerase